MSWFMNRMKGVAGIIEELYKNIEPLVMTSEDEVRFREATSCHMCGKPLENDRVRDHCHLTGNKL